MARPIWSQKGNPTRNVARQLGIERWQLRDALHNIKRRSGLGPADDVEIWDDGSVTDSDGNLCGVIFDEI